MLVIAYCLIWPRTKDLEVIIDNSLHFYEHISIITGRAHARAYIIHKCYIYRNTQPLVRRFVAYVRPILEYTSSTWSPSTITNIKMVDSVQKRFTKRLKRLHKVDYQNRLITLGLNSLELRRLSAGLTLTYKILFGLIDVDPTQLFNIYNCPPLHGHIYSLHCNTQRLNTGHHLFSSHVIAPCNSLPIDVFLLKVWTVSNYR